MLVEESDTRYLARDTIRHNDRVKAQTAYFHCGDQLRATLASEIGEVLSAVAAVQWIESFSHATDDALHEHQAGYNRALGNEFRRMGWESQPTLRTNPKLIGDFRKGLVLIEIQFGNSATLYRDYYKFQYGLANGLLSLAVLIVPTAPARFFPSRPPSVKNMAEYALAHSCFTVLPINVPTMLVGLLPEN
jgi:hypothetical protein